MLWNEMSRSNCIKVSGAIDTRVSGHFAGINMQVHFLCSPCIDEFPDVCGSQNEHVFDVQKAFLVKLDTLCNF